MCYLVKNHHLRILVLLILLFSVIAFSPRSPATAARGNAGTALRLRLRVERNSLRPGEATKITVEFLDRDYQPVVNSGTRVIEFRQGDAAAGQTGSGNISPSRVTVPAGALSAETKFASTQSGRVLISASSGGLDGAQIFLLVTRPAASFLSTLFESVAYAAEADGFEILPKKREMPANDSSRAQFQVSLLEAPPAGTKVRIYTNPAATIVFNGKDSDGFAEIEFPPNSGMSDYIFVKSRTAARVEVRALLSDGRKDEALANFIAPRPSRIVFNEDSPDIPPYHNKAHISLKLADAGFKAMDPDREERITFRSANDDDPVEFVPASVVVSQSQPWAQAEVHLKGPPLGNELEIWAESKDLMKGQKTLFIHSPNQQVMLTAPPEVRRGKTPAEVIISLADKNGMRQSADWDRKINLSVSSGSLNQTQVTIPKGQDEIRVQFTSSGATGKVQLRAQSRGLAEGSLELTLVTALSWLIGWALIGGLVGGIVLQVRKDYRLKQILPKRTEECVELGLVGRVATSIVCGLFLYLAIKYGLGRALPATLDSGTSPVAFLLGGFGGFASTAVFDWGVGCIPGLKKEEAKNTPVGPGQPSHTKA